MARPYLRTIMKVNAQIQYTSHWYFTEGSKYRHEGVVTRIKAQKKKRKKKKI